MEDSRLAAKCLLNRTVPSTSNALVAEHGIRGGFKTRSFGMRVRVSPSAPMKELLFSVTKKDLRVEWFRGSGKGGQKRNKTSNNCRITHPESGAVGVGQEGRSATANQETAFLAMFHHPKFQAWYKIKCGRLALTESEIQAWVAQQMRPKNLLVEFYDASRERWIKQ